MPVTTNKSISGSISGNVTKTPDAPVVGGSKFKPEDLLPKGNQNNLNARTIRDVEDYFSMCAYGDYGCGKTYFAGSAVFVPEYRDILYVSLEAGERGLKQVILDGEARGIDVNKHILVVQVNTYKTFSLVFEALVSHLKYRDTDDLAALRKIEANLKGYSKEQIDNDELMEYLFPEPMRFRTVITDSLTEAQKYCMYSIMGIHPDRQRLDVEPSQAEWAEWGKSREMIQFLVRRFKALPINKIYVAAEEITQDQFKKNHYDLQLPGKLAKDVRGLMDYVCYINSTVMEGGGVNRKFCFQNGDYGNVQLKAKHRFGNRLKSSYLENITMEEIYKLDKI